MAEGDQIFLPVSVKKSRLRRGEQQSRKAVTGAPAVLTLDDIEVSATPLKKMGRFAVAIRGDGFELTDEIIPRRAADRTRVINLVVERLSTTKDCRAILKKTLMPLHEILQQKAAEATAAVEAEADARAAEQALTSSDHRSKSKDLLAEMPQDVVESAIRFLRDPKMFETLKSDLDSLGIVGEGDLTLTVYVIGTSRLLAKPLGGIVKGASSAGKSFVTNIVISLMPPEQVLQTTAISPQALFYLPPGSLVHKLVCVAERKHATGTDDADHANSGLALREMLSTGRLMKIVTDSKGPDGLQSRRVEQEGPIAYIETTTQETLLEEDENRLLQLAPDETRAQTKRIIMQIAREESATAAKKANQEAIRQKHHAAQRLLETYDVRVPFAELLAVPDDKIIARRAFGQLIGCIKAVALLRQFQKKPRGGRLIATPKDYEVAYGIMFPILKRAFSAVNEKALALYDVIHEHSHTFGFKFTRRDCCNWSGLSNTEVRTRLKILIDDELVVQPEDARPGRRIVYRIPDPSIDPRLTLKGMISPDVLRGKMKRASAETAAVPNADAGV